MKKWIWFLIFLLLLVACKQDGAGKWQADEIIKIDGNPVKAEEVAIYGIQAKKEFEEIGGLDVWEFESFSGGKSAYEVAKTKVLENLVRVKVLATKAGERKIELSDQEKDKARREAERFYQEQQDLASAGQIKISLDRVEQVFVEFEVGKKLKQEMLRDFQPSQEMIETKLKENDRYRELETSNPRDKYEYYVLEIAAIEAVDQNKELIGKIQEELEENRYLTDDLSQSMVYQETKYNKTELETIFGLGITDHLQVNPQSLFLDEEANQYLLVKLKGMELGDKNALANDLKDLHRQKENLRIQAEEEVRNESFDVIYQEWKKETEIQVNQEKWQEFIVFSLPDHKN